MATTFEIPDDALASLVSSLCAGWAAAPIGLADDAVVAIMNAEVAGRHADALRVKAAGMVAAESAPEFGAEGLARRNGFTSTAKFIAAMTGSTVATASKRLKLAAATHSTTSLVGLANPSRFPVVEEALASGSLGLDAAVVITRRLDDAAKRCGFTDAVADAEAELVDL